MALLATCESPARPTPAQLVGGVVLLAGVALAASGEQAAARVAAAETE